MSLKKHKILFLTPSLNYGGAEKNIRFLVENLHTNFEIILCIQNFAEYNNDHLKIVNLNKSRFIYSIFDIIKLILVEKPKLIFSSSIQINIFLGFVKYFFKVKTIIRETNIPSQRFKYSTKKIPYYLRKYFLKKNDAIICQSNDMYFDFMRHYKLKKLHQKKIIVIPNPVTNINLKNNCSNKENNLITIGSLTPKKGYERVFKAIKDLDLDFKYNILGSGELNESLHKLMAEYGLANKISFNGQKKNVYDYLSNAQLFLLGSYIEGFPNVILESLSVGTPCLIFKDSLGGQKEIVIDGFNGYICENIDDFREKIKISLEKIWNRKKIAEDVKHRFAKNLIINKYKKLFDDVLLH